MVPQMNERSFSSSGSSNGSRSGSPPRDSNIENAIVSAPCAPAEEVLLAEVQRLNEEVAKREKMLATYNMSWEEKLANTEAHAVECDTELTENRKALALPGDEIEDGVSCLVNLNQDPLFSECLVYYIREGVTTIGLEDASDIVLSGGDMLQAHAEIWAAGAGGWDEGSDDATKSGGGGENGRTVALLAKDDAVIFVNGIEIGDAYDEGEDGGSSRNNDGSETCRCVELYHGDRVVFGRSHFFRFEARAGGRQDSEKKGAAAGGACEVGVGAKGGAQGEEGAGVSEYDWGFAQRELQQCLAERGRSDEQQQVHQQKVLAQRAQARLETMQNELEKQRLRSERQQAKQKMSSARKAKRQRAQTESYKERVAGLEQAEAEISDLRQQLDLQLEKVAEVDDEGSTVGEGECGELVRLQRQLSERDQQLARSEAERRRLLALVAQVDQNDPKKSSFSETEALVQQNTVLAQEKMALLQKVEEQREAAAVMRRAQKAQTEAAAKAKKNQTEAAQARRQLQWQLKEQGAAHQEAVDGLRSCYEQMLTEARAKVETAEAAAAAAEDSQRQIQEAAGKDGNDSGMSASTSSSMAKLEQLADQMRQMRHASERPAKSAIDFGQHAEALESAASSALLMEQQLSEAKAHIKRQEAWEAKALARDAELQRRVEELMQVQAQQPPSAPSVHDQEQAQVQIQKRAKPKASEWGDSVLGKRSPLVDTHHNNNVLGAARTWPGSRT
jgi:hypothetical protein